MIHYINTYMVLLAAVAVMVAVAECVELLLDL